MLYLFRQRCCTYSDTFQQCLTDADFFVVEFPLFRKWQFWEVWLIPTYFETVSLIPIINTSVANLPTRIIIVANLPTCYCNVSQMPTKSWWLILICGLVQKGLFTNDVIIVLLNKQPPRPQFHQLSYWYWYWYWLYFLSDHRHYWKAMKKWFDDWWC